MEYWKTVLKKKYYILTFNFKINNFAENLTHLAWSQEFRIKLKVAINFIKITHFNTINTR